MGLLVIGCLGVCRLVTFAVGRLAIIAMNVVTDTLMPPGMILAVIPMVRPVVRMTHDVAYRDPYLVGMREDYTGHCSPMNL